MFVQEHAMGFLGLWDLVSKKRHKATTPNGVPQGEGCLWRYYLQTCTLLSLLFVMVVILYKQYE